MFKRKRENCWPSRSFRLLLGIAALMGGCSGALPGPYPKDRWLRSDLQGWFIFSTWEGVTGSRTMYGYDGTPVQVATLHEVQGPHPFEVRPPRQPSTASLVSGGDRVEYLANANLGVITTEKLPAGLRVRVEGFKRPERRSVAIYNPHQGFWQVASLQPPGPPGQRTIDRVPVIQTKKIVQVLPDGSDKVVWETDVPFRGL